MIWEQNSKAGAQVFVIVWQYSIANKWAVDLWMVDTSRNTCRWSVGTRTSMKESCPIGGHENEPVAISCWLR